MKKLLLPLSALVLASVLTTTGLAQNNDSKDAAKKLAATTTLMDSIPDIIFYKDMDGVYRGGNKAWTQLLGKPLDQLLGKTDLDLFPAELAKSFRAKDREMLATRQPTRNEEWVDYPGGRHAMLDTLKTPWVDATGKVLGVLGICREITPDPAVEKEVRAANDRFYAALNAMFTGELAPMNAIWSHADDISNQGPFGDRMDGWSAVGAEFKKEAGMKLGGRVVCQNLIVRAGKDLGYTVCVEVGENMTAAGKPVKVSHRATNVFRREKGQWHLVHHHTDLSPQLGEAVGTPEK